jgi:hypothetical protein
MLPVSLVKEKQQAGEEKNIQPKKNMHVSYIHLQCLPTRHAWMSLVLAFATIEAFDRCMNAYITCCSPLPPG